MALYRGAVAVARTDVLKTIIDTLEELGVEAYRLDAGDTHHVIYCSFAAIVVEKIPELALDPHTKRITLDTGAGGQRLTFYWEGRRAREHRVRGDEYRVTVILPPLWDDHMHIMRGHIIELVSAIMRELGVKDAFFTEYFKSGELEELKAWLKERLAVAKKICQLACRVLEQVKGEIARYMGAALL